MRSDSPGRRRASKLFAVYSAASLVPVVALGALLAVSYRADANRRGLAEARSQAALLAEDVVAPVVGDAPLRGPVSPGARMGLRQAFDLTKDDGRLVRLRLRDVTGAVIWSDDGSGLSSSAPDDEVLDALHGDVVSKLTRLNADADDVGPLGPRVVEIYRPIKGSSGDAPIGVLEMYVPYAPIAADVNAGLQRMYGLLGVGLAALWLVLALISVSTTNRLRKQSQRLEYLAHHDEALGLLNRVGFGEEVARRSALDPVRPPAVALVNVARFRQINEALGRPSGDEVLRQLGRRLVVTAGSSAVVGRLGGDEFGVASFAHSDDDLAEWAATLQSAVSEPIEAAGVPVLVELAVGYDGGKPGQAVEELLSHADAALARAKGAIDRRSSYRETAAHADASSLSLMARLRDAIPAGGLELHYQPKTSLDDGRVVSVEALVRWRVGETLLMPQAFLPSAEQTALIHPLTEWVAREALRQLDGWGATGDGIDVAINVSARNLSEPLFAERLLSIAEDSGVDTRRLTVEITETALLVDPDAARESLKVIHDAGMAVSIDDFGQGQTSLSYLASLPVDELKIDRAFVSRICVDPMHDAIVRSVIQLGHSLGLRVVAEGIEDESTIDRLATLGADVGQGYFIARPMPATAFGAWRAQHSRSPLRVVG
ncbi:MAG TPA: bifunctional diguanylate cyclase/phosphodiesterase [Acidothermaceae bacterium]